jgi:hypothetical protein
MGRIPLSRLISARTLANARPSRPVVSVPREFLEQVAADPSVQDWLISASEIENVRCAYLEHLARFLHWAGWTPSQLFMIKRAALKKGEPRSEVEAQIKRYHETLRLTGKAGKTRAKLVAAVCSYISSGGYTIPRKLVRLDMANKFEMRVPEREEIEHFVDYASTPQKKLLYILMTESPCRPRVFPALCWNWLEPDWRERDVVHVVLPRQYRPGSQGPRKLEPICFIGSKSVARLKQLEILRGEVEQLKASLSEVLKVTALRPEH